MNFDDARFEDVPFGEGWDLPGDCQARILVSGLSPSNHEVHYLLDFGARVAHRCEIDIGSYARAMADYLAARLEPSHLPYGLVAYEAVTPNFLQPHEGLMLDDRWVAVAMHNAGYLRLIDFERRRAGNFPDGDGFVPEMLSATNSVSARDGRLYFSRTPLDQRLAKYRGEVHDLETTLESCTTAFSDVRAHAAVRTGEAIHEVKVLDGAEPGAAPGRVLMTEFLLVAARRPPPVSRARVLDEPDLWRDYAAGGLNQSHLYAHDLATKSTRAWGPTRDTPGHVEVSLADPDLVYLSCHNLSKACGRLWLHGPGRLVQIALGPDGPDTRRQFQEETFLRVTSHKVFAYRGVRYVAATVYPNWLYLFHDPSLEVAARVQLFPHDPIDARSLHRCDLQDHMPLWIETSDDGRFVILVANDVVYVYDLDNGRLVANRGYTRHEPLMITAHITNLSYRPPAPARALGS